MALALAEFDVLRTGKTIVFVFKLTDGTGAIITSGTCSLYLYEVQDDGTLKSFDFDNHTFKTGALTTETASSSHRQGNNSSTNTGLWTYALSTLTGFTDGGLYIVQVHHSSSAEARPSRQFVYGGGRTELHLVKATLANDLVFTNESSSSAAGQVLIKDDDGTTTLATLTPYETISVSGADWDEGTLTITQTGAFSNYRFVTGDLFTVTSGATAGQYTIASKIDADSIVLSSDCNSAGGDIADNTLVGYISNGRIMRISS